MPLVSCNVTQINVLQNGRANQQYTTTLLPIVRMMAVIWREGCKMGTLAYKQCDELVTHLEAGN
jgi:hypothetical protein